MKVNLSKATCERLRKTAENDAATPVQDGGISQELFEKIAWELATRDDKGRLTLSPDVVDWVFAQLDWYCSAYVEDARS